MRRRTLLGRGALAAGVLSLAAIPAFGLTAGADIVPEAGAPPFAVHDHPLGYQADALRQQQFFDAVAFATALGRAQYIEAAEAAAAAQAAAAHRSSGHGGGGGCASGDFECFRACTINRESHGNYTDSSANGQYRGAWQFNQSTWDSNAAASGRTDLVGTDPAAASPSDQDSVAYSTYQSRGKQPWGGRC